MNELFEFQKELKLYRIYMIFQKTCWSFIHFNWEKKRGKKQKSTLVPINKKSKHQKSNKKNILNFNHFKNWSIESIDPLLGAAVTFKSLHNKE